MIWNMWKKSFYAWENATADYLEEVLKNPLVLGPSGKLLGAVMKLKAKKQEKATNLWSSLGLPTKHDQERSLHALNKLESRLLDMEEQLWELKQTKNEETAN
jgi:polyhydroxyalkanoate synthesis regulator phasin